MTVPPSSESFFDVPRQNASTSVGDVELPILYFDGFSGTALFDVDPAVAREVLATFLMETPAEADLTFLPVQREGTATAAITFYDYRDTSIGPYREVALALLVVPRRIATGDELGRGDAMTGSDAKPGFCILDLPVTTPLAEAAGRELWGYPKFLAGVDVDVADGCDFRGQLRDERGDVILELAGRAGESTGETKEGRDVVTYSSQAQGQESDMQLLSTTITTACDYTALLPGTLALQVGESKHPMATRLRELGLGGRTPLRWQTTSTFRARLPLGQVVD